MKYAIINKRNRNTQVVEARTKPTTNLDHFVKRVREKVVVLSKNQSRKLKGQEP